MRLATVRLDGRTSAVRIEGDDAVVLDAVDVRAVLEGATAETGDRRPVAGLDYAPLILSPDKIICVGLNYRSHIHETGMELPSHPTLFTKFGSALVGAHDVIELPVESDQCDWEAELAIVIGAAGRRIAVESADQHIAGYTVMNDVSVRDWQMRTTQWLPGKSWERTTPLGPWLVTRDETPGPSRRISCEVDGEVRQDADTADLVFGPAELIAHISTFVTLLPGDVIATGTPGGVGMGSGRWLDHGAQVVTRVEGVGECRNLCLRGPA
jgi:acylpyruvate hydrolase